MPTIAIHEDMSSARSSSSPAATGMDQEEPRKKGIPSIPSPRPSGSTANACSLNAGARGGKRSVTHLSKAQLARKRANDREAQRNIRQRTKEHIENLERKVKELEENTRTGSMERLLARNRELEEEIEKLRAQVRARPTTPVSAGPNPQDVAEELLIPQKVELEWMQGPNRNWVTSLPSHIPSLPAEAAVSAPFANDTTLYATTPPMSTNGFVDDETEAGQRIFTQAQAQAPQAIPIWDDPSVFGPQAAQSQSLSKPAPTWTPFHPAFSQPSRFADLQQSGFADVLNNHNQSFATTTCWQSQPSIYAWQLSTKLKAPVTHVDHLMMSVIQSQRHMAITTGLSGEDLIGADLPPVHVLFDQPGPVKPPTSLTEVMAR